MIIDLTNYIWGYGKCILKAADSNISTEEVHLYSSGILSYEFITKEIMDDFDNEIFVINNGVRPIVEINDIYLLNSESATVEGSIFAITSKLLSIINAYMTANKHPKFNMLINCAKEETSINNNDNGVYLDNMLLNIESFIIENVVEKRKFGQIIKQLRFKRQTPQLNISTAYGANVYEIDGYNGGATLYSLTGTVDSTTVTLKGIN